jgi:hypothetical protein
MFYLQMTSRVAKASGKSAQSKVVEVGDEKLSQEVESRPEMRNADGAIYRVADRALDVKQREPGLMGGREL